jgi:hypothetical protein
MGISDSGPPTLILSILRTLSNTMLGLLRFSHSRVHWRPFAVVQVMAIRVHSRPFAVENWLIRGGHGQGVAARKNMGVEGPGVNSKLVELAARMAVCQFCQAIRFVESWIR